MPHRARFRYEPLDPSKDELRLLELQPADRLDDPVVCRFVHVSLQQQPDVEFFGIAALLRNPDDDGNEPVTLDGKAIVLPANIAQALRHARAAFPRQGQSGRARSQSTKSTSNSSDRQPTPTPDSNRLPPPPAPKKAPGWPRRLFGTVGGRSNSTTLSTPSPAWGASPLLVWMDALCLNPRDAAEVASQRASRIAAYWAARVVVGWLGPKDETTDKAIEIITTIDRAMPVHFGTKEHRQKHPEHYAPRLEWMAGIAHLWDFGPGAIKLEDTLAYKSIANLLGRTWFQRDWIITETGKASFPALLIGDEIVGWDAFMRWHRCNEELVDHGFELFPEHYRGLIHQFMPLSSIYALLNEFERRKPAGGGS